MLVRIAFLGTGTSHGVPMIGCDCAVCTSPDPRDTRTRPSIFLEHADGTSILVDTSPDFRAQALRQRIRRVDAILFTHAHADHIFGMDDVRPLQKRSGPMCCFGDAATMAAIGRVFAYAFEERTWKGGGVPDLRLWTVGGGFCVGGVEIMPVPVCHGQQMILGFRMGRFAYLTDCNAIPETSLPLLWDLDVLVLDALRPDPHPTHFSLGEAIDTARRIGAARTYFTHMCHHLGHAETCASLPPGMALAYDGLHLDVA